MHAYAILKRIHVVSVILWVGGVFTVDLIMGRVARAGDRALFSSLLGHTTVVGRGVIGPSVMLTLLTGIGMMMTGRLDGGALWIQWGFAGVVAHFLFGPVLLRRAGVELQRASTDGDEPRRVGRLNAIYLALLLSVVGAMVLKPTL